MIVFGSLLLGLAAFLLLLATAFVSGDMAIVSIYLFIGAAGTFLSGALFIGLGQILEELRQIKLAFYRLLSV